MGDFANWITGETDYTIAAPPSPKARMVCHKWGVIVTDETFEPLFVEFLAHFRRYEFRQENPGAPRGRSGWLVGQRLAGLLRTMYSAYQSGQFVSY